MKRVLCIYMGKRRPPGGCEIYRGNMPLHHLGLSGQWAVGWEYFEDAWNAAVKVGPRYWLDMIRSTDLIVFPRIVIPEAPEARHAMADLFHVARSLGTRIVYETDDDYTGEFRYVSDGDTISAAAWADAITVTTPYLGDTMAARAHRPIHVLPNCISPGDFRAGSAPPRQDSMKDKIIIALTGSQSHKLDWLVMRDVMPLILQEFPQAHFLLMGYQPEYLKGLQNTSYIEGLRYDSYARVLRGCDIILAPVDPKDGFNLGKSPIKAVEGMAAERKLPDGTPAGALVIATDNPIYRLAVQDGKTGLLVEHTPKGWLDALRTIIPGTERRNTLQASGHRWVYKHHDITKEWKQWARAYKTILNSPPNSSPLPTTLVKGSTS